MCDKKIKENETKITKDLLMERLNTEFMKPQALSDETFDECACFLFLMCWLEERLFNEKWQQKPQHTKKLCENLYSEIDIDKFDQFGKYFSCRYIDGEKTTTAFENLKLDPRIVRSVEESLINYKNEGTKDEKLLIAYISIIYRFRNNLFHGTKGLENIPTYTKEFKMINNFLIDFLKKIYDIDYNGFNGPLGELPHSNQNFLNIKG